MSRTAQTLPDRRAHARGFRAVAFAFSAAMAFTTVPTPLWSLYQARDGFSSFTVTLVFSAYAVGVAGSLFFAGHLSDWHGRRRLLLPALALNVLAAVLFLLWPDLPGLVLARLLSGIGVGAVTATATAWLAELDATARPGTPPRRAAVTATVANLGGLALGSTLSGLLAQWVAQPLVVPFAVSLATLLAAVALVRVTPETRAAAVPRPRYRAQRIAVPASARGRYAAAAVAALIAMAALGLFSALTGSFLAGSFHARSHALAGAVAGGVLGAAVLAQVVTAAWEPRRVVAAGVAATPAGLALLVLAVWLPQPSLALFLIGGVVTGAAAGLLFKGAIVTAAALATDDSRAEALAGIYLAGYVGLAGPVVGLGLLTRELSARAALLIFAAALAAAVAAAAPVLLGRGGRRGAEEPGAAEPSAARARVCV